MSTLKVPGWRRLLAAIAACALVAIAGVPTGASAATVSPAQTSVGQQQFGPAELTADLYGVAPAAPAATINIRVTSRITAGVFPYGFAWCLDNSAPHRNGSAVRAWRCHGGSRPVNQTWTWSMTGNSQLPYLQIQFTGPHGCLVNYHNRADIYPCRAPPFRAVWAGSCYYRVASGNRFLTFDGPYRQMVFAPRNTQVPNTQKFYFKGPRCP